jgi:hypothetical protein
MRFAKIFAQALRYSLSGGNDEAMNPERIELTEAVDSVNLLDSVA